MRDVETDELITVAAAIAVIDGVAVGPRVERVGLLDADGRVLAANVEADRDTPPFDKSLMDGYAVRAVDTAAASAGPLRCVGEVAAGAAMTRSLATGECVAIMTGAPLPPGADAVVPVERTTRDADLVTLVAVVKTGDAVSPRGIEAHAGRVVLTAGTLVGPAQLAAAAQVGAAHVDVFARPRVGVLSSGDEIIPFDQTPAGSQVRGSNSILLAALLRRYGCDPIDLGHVRDDPALIAEALSTAGLDALCVTGGMSMGAYDYTPRVLRELGYDLAITKLKIKPGKPFVFARRPATETLSENAEPHDAVAAGGHPRESQTNGDGKRFARVHTRGCSPPAFVFGLPGNPFSAFVCTVRLASRLLLRMTGRSPEPEWIVATLAEALPANGPREFYQPVVVTHGVARPLRWNGSADVFTLAAANALLCRPADETACPAGRLVSLLRLP